MTAAVEAPTAAFSALGPMPSLLAWLAQINIILAIFNLVPGFPLDGGRVLRAIMWGITGDFLAATRLASRGGQVIAWMLMAIGFLMVLGLHVPFFGTGPVSGLWLIFIGWFLNNAAVMSYRQLIVRYSLEGVPVSRLMQTRFTRVDPDMPVTILLDEHVMASGQRAFPVEQDGASLAAPGLYFCGVHFMRKRKSSLLIGVGEDAAIVARAVVARAQSSGRTTRPAGTFG